jgi:hypothetical protein
MRLAGVESSLFRIDSRASGPLISAVQRRVQTVRRGARWAFVVHAALATMAAGSAARAEVLTINLDKCSGSCSAPAIDDPSTAKSDAAAKTTLSRSGGKTGHPNDPSAALVFDRKTTPPVLASGLPSPLASPDVAPDGVSPYDYFEDVIDIPLPADARADFAAASLFLFAPSLLGRLTLTDVLSAGAALFGK